MALAPNPAGDPQASISKYMEKLLDTLLFQDMIGQWVESEIPVAYLFGMTPEVFEALKMRYLSAGWKVVEWVKDEAEGDYLRFSL